MKHSRNNHHLKVYKPRQPLYPNAADNRYFAQKALDIMTALVACIGFTSAMLFLATLA